MSVLNRLLPKTSNYNPGGGSSNYGTLSQSDIAGAVGTLSDDLGAQMLVYKDNGRSAAGWEMINLWRQRVRKTAAREGWQTKDQDRITWLADGTLEEYMMEHTVCPCCDGEGTRHAIKREENVNGEISPQGKTAGKPKQFVRVRKTIVCERCNGQRFIPAKTVDRANALRVDQKSFKDYWIKRWDGLVSELGQLEWATRAELKRRLR